MRRLLQLIKLHLNGWVGETYGIGGAWGKGKKKEEARMVLELMEEFMFDVNW